MAEAGVDFPLIHASAEEIPLPDASFDVVFSDHGALSWADPHVVVPEVARVLRPGGILAFNVRARSCAFVTTRRRTRPTRRSTAPTSSSGSRTRRRRGYLRAHRRRLDPSVARNELSVEALFELRPPEVRRRRTGTTFSRSGPPVARRTPVEGAKGMSERKRRGLDARQQGLHGRARRAGLAEGRDRLGSLAGAESELRALPDVSGKDVVELGCGTAYFRRLAEEARRAACRRRRPDPRATRDRAAPGRDDRDRARAGRGVRRGRAAPGCVLRRRRVGVRRVDLGRPVQVDPGGGPPAATRRGARVPAQLHARHPVLARRRPRRGRSTPAVRDVPLRVVGGRGRRRRVPPLARRLDPACCATTASRSST